MSKEMYILTLPESAHVESVFTVIEMYDEIDEVNPCFEAPLLNIYAMMLPEDINFDTVQSINDSDFVLSLKPARGVTKNYTLVHNTKHLEVEPDFEYDPSIVTESIQPEIAIIDSGVDQRNDNLNEVHERHDYTEGNEWDSTGHGTAIALIHQEFLPSAAFYDMKVLSGEMLSEISVIGAINDAIAQEVDIINISLGFPTRYKPNLCPLCHAVNTAVKNDIPVVASAGNHGTQRRPMPEPLCPACAESTVATGSLDKEGNKKSYSAMADRYERDDWLLKDLSRKEDEENSR